MWKTPKKKLNDRKILIIQRPLPFRRPSRHLFQTFQTTSRHHQEAFQTPSIFLPDNFKTNSRILSDIWWTQFRGLIDTFHNLPNTLQTLLSGMNSPELSGVVGGWNCVKITLKLIFFYQFWWGTSLSFYPYQRIRFKVRYVDHFSFLNLDRLLL